MERKKKIWWQNWKINLRNKKGIVKIEKIEKNILKKTIYKIG